MTLILPSPSEPKWQDNWAATPTINTTGTTITSNASANTKGSYVTLIATTNFDVCGVSINVQNNTASAAVRNMLIDLAVGAAASEGVVAANLMISGNTGGWITPSGYLFLPINIKKGSRLSARCQCSTGAQTANLAIVLHGVGDFPAYPSFSGVETIGANTATSAGATHSPGSTGSYSAWANLGSTTARQYKAILPMISTGSDTTMTSLLGYAEFGVASTLFWRNIFVTNNTEAIGSIFPNVPFYKRFPSGTQFMMRSTMSGVADTDYQFGLLGFY